MRSHCWKPGVVLIRILSSPAGAGHPARRGTRSANASPFGGFHPSAVSAIATEQGWKPPSYERVRQIIKNLDPALLTMAHQGAAAYREEFDLLYRREASHANAIWQANHAQLPGCDRAHYGTNAANGHLAQRGSPLACLQ